MEKSAWVREEELATPCALSVSENFFIAQTPLTILRTKVTQGHLKYYLIILEHFYFTVIRASQPALGCRSSYCPCLEMRRLKIGAGKFLGRVRLPEMRMDSCPYLCLAQTTPSTFQD